MTILVSLNQLKKVLFNTIVLSLFLSPFLPVMQLKAMERGVAALERESGALSRLGERAELPRPVEMEEFGLESAGRKAELFRREGVLAAVRRAPSISENTKTFIAKVDELIEENPALTRPYREEIARLSDIYEQAIGSEARQKILYQMKHIDTLQRLSMRLFKWQSYNRLIDWFSRMHIPELNAIAGELKMAMDPAQEIKVVQGAISQSRRMLMANDIFTTSADVYALAKRESDIIDWQNSLLLNQESQKLSSFTGQVRKLFGNSRTGQALSDEITKNMPAIKKIIDLQQQLDIGAMWYGMIRDYAPYYTRTHDYVLHSWEIRKTSPPALVNALDDFDNYSLNYRIARYYRLRELDRESTLLFANFAEKFGAIAGGIIATILCAGVISSPITVLLPVFFLVIMPKLDAKRKKEAMRKQQMQAIQPGEPTVRAFKGVGQGLGSGGMN